VPGVLVTMRMLIMTGVQGSAYCLGELWMHLVFGSAVPVMQVIMFPT
jgi:hypothetical protein